MKLDVKDLRIENLVNDEETTHTVVGIDQWHVYSYWQKDKEKEMLYKTPMNQIKPIPLTEEWLLKFGFVEEKIIRNRKIFRLEEKHFRVEITAFGYVVYYTIDKFLIYYGEHIHQLQNLYFALTSEELQIK